ncbi:M61 family metallopeptidase [Robiginitalea sp. IMCC44478]|uniref:M61 family metallopeptidase n=1 Tax=Robiginitalea sp. IMCC44478 TaxID=3459122 RepID=UPI00404159A1
MKRTLLYFSFLFFISNQAYCHSKDSLRADHYQLIFDSGHPDQILVKASLQLQDSLLYMSPYGPMPERWPDYVRNLTVTNTEGMPLPFFQSGSGWILKETVAGQQVHLTYEMVLEHEEISWPGGIDGVAYKRDWGIMASGRSLFLMNGKDKKAIEVRISRPEKWLVSLPWEAAGTGEETYIARDLVDLQESFLFAGTHKETLITRDGFTLKFVLGGDAVVAQEQQFTRVATEVMDYYIGLMGGIPKPGPGRSMRQSMVIIGASENMDGEVIGNHISMFMNPQGDTMSRLMGWFMFTHEFFHLWNGKTLRFSDSSTEWFKEGFSNYYTIKALHSIGFVSEEAILGMLNHLFYQRYIQDPGYGSLPPSQAASGFSKDNHWGLIYGGGLFAAIAMDMEIRHNTENSSSLDDLMRQFYNDYAGKSRTIDRTAIVSAANAWGRTDFSAFIQAHIEGVQPIDLQPYLKYAGVEVNTSDKQLTLTHMPEKTPMQAALWEGFLGKAN